MKLITAITPDPGEVSVSGFRLTNLTSKHARLLQWQRSGKPADEFAAIEGCSRASLYRHRATMAEKGLVALVDKRKGNSGRKPETVDRRVVEYALAYIERHKGATLKALHKQIKMECEKRNWKPIGYRKLVSTLRGLPDDFTDLLQKGSKAWHENNALLARHGDLEVNEEWAVDLSEVPVWVLDVTTMRLFKPWLTSFIDGASRVITGWHLTPRVPTAADVILALRFAIFPKGDPSYPYYGKPDGAQSDNGGVFVSEDYQQALLRAGIAKLPIPKSCPQKNGKIERWFGTAATGLWSTLNGYADQHQALRDAQKYAIPWPVLPRIVANYLADYHSTPHSELGGKSPWEVWHDQVATARGLQPDKDAIMRAMMVSSTHTVDTTGVRLADGNEYQGACLEGFVGKTVTLRTPPDRSCDIIEAYHDDRYLGDLVDANATPELAEELADLRKGRKVELYSLRKHLRGMGEQMLEDPADCPPGYVETNDAGDAAGDAAVSVAAEVETETTEAQAPGQVPEMKPEE